ncbi:nitrile hydratase accessory protein [Pseudomonas aeruginosa]|nr:nitrile hydratase accessory protein [Pseudomonas aeruginosa]MCS8463982.1 nitrile hydratase accessory protein [Pseudomonas aeruginosa]MCS8467678.1 nitrile hydratase accessory protein [Pseudomonas aeruginosa]
MQPHELLDQVHGAGLAHLSFTSPWAARLFGMTLTAAQKEIFSLQDFQQALIASIQRHEQGSCIDSDEQYYSCWLVALQGLLEQHELIQSERIAVVEAEIMAKAQQRHDHQRTGHHHHDHHVSHVHHAEPEQQA